MNGRLLAIYNDISNNLLCLKQLLERFVQDCTHSKAEQQIRQQEHAIIDDGV